MSGIDQISLGFLLFDAARLLRRRFEQECRDRPMTSAHLRIIKVLRHNEGTGQGRSPVCSISNR